MKTITVTLVLLMAATLQAQQFATPEGVSITDGTLLICESKNKVWHTCKVDARGRMVTVNQQLSQNPCILGQTWGFTRNRKGIWVDDGCRGEFVLGGERGFTPMTSAAPTTLVCESQNNDLNRCAANTFFGVTLARQISNSTCIRGRTWGYDANGIWVTGGCREHDIDTPSLQHIDENIRSGFHHHQPHQERRDE